MRASSCYFACPASSREMPKVSPQAAPPHTKEEEKEEKEKDEEDEEDLERQRRPLSSCLRLLRRHLLLCLTLLGVCGGLGLGIALNLIGVGEEALLWIGLPGDLLLRSFRLLIVPLVFATVFGIASGGGAGASGRVGGLTLTYVLVTNMAGAALGLAFAMLIKPGSRDAEVAEFGDSKQGDGGRLTTTDILTDLLRNLVPDNIVTMAFETSQTRYSSRLLNETLVHTRENGTARGMNVLGVMFVGVLIGVATGQMDGEDARVFKAFFRAMATATTWLLARIMWLLPFGLLSLIAKSLAEVPDIPQTFASLGVFMATVAGALATNQLLMHTAMYVAFVRKNPLKFYPKIIKAYLVAFSTTSSVSALPVMLECADNAGLRQRVSRFVLPLCCNTNSDGSCAFIAASVIFVAQFVGVTVGPGDAVLIAFLSGVSGMSLPSVPSSSLVVIVGILSNIGIPDASVSLLYTGEFLLDRLRTGCNTWSHCTCAAAMSARLPLTDEEKVEAPRIELRDAGQDCMAEEEEVEVVEVDGSGRRTALLRADDGLAKTGQNWPKLAKTSAV